jgi:hypothetical protein
VSVGWTGADRRSRLAAPFATGAAVGLFGGLIGLGAEFRLPHVERLAVRDRDEQAWTSARRFVGSRL